MSASSALIAEDEAPQRRDLRLMLSELWPELDIVAECSDGLTALEEWTRHKPNIVFLDIRMPGVSGLEVAKAVSGQSHVVFTTAYEQYALQAFDRGAIDYLLKPIKRDRLLVAVQRLRERLQSGNDVPDLTHMIDALEKRWAPRQSGIRWITANAGHTTKMFPIDEVLYFQAQEKYTRVVTLADEAIIRTPLKELLDGLNSDEFWQVHRSAIVRVDAVQSLQRRDDGKLELRIRGRDDVLPVSSAFQYRFKGM